MLEFTSEQIQKYLTGVVIFTIFYLIIFHIKGRRKNLAGYSDAVKSCIIYAVMGVFFIVGIGLVKPLIVDKQYLGLLVPLGWLFIICLGVRACLKNDFDIDINIIKVDPVKRRLIWEIIIYSIIAIGFAFASGMIFFVAVPDLENQPYGPIPLVIAGLIFGIVSIILIRTIYYKITKKKNVFNSKSMLNIFQLIFTLFGVLAIVLGVYDAKDKGEAEIWFFIVGIIFIIIPALVKKVCK